MSVYVESNIEFDFTAATTVIEHDKATPTHPGGPVHNNSIWPGVDFCIEDASGDWIWLEVKNWNPTHITPNRRGGSRWSFLCKMRSNEYAREMRAKFLGTTAFLAWKNAFPLAPTRFVLLFEPPHPLDAALLGSRITRMQGLIPRRHWAQPITVSILTVREWNRRMGIYPARAL